MKAATIPAAGRIDLAEHPTPEPPADGLLLRVKACGICGSDVRRWKEGPADASRVGIPGHEIAGEVVAVGGEARGFAVGDLLALGPDVHCGECFFCRRGLFNLCEELRLIGISPDLPGGFAEYLAVTGTTLSRGIVHRAPEGVTFAHAALAEPCSSVLACHDRTHTSPDHTVAVLGAGPIGCLHVVIARLRGARVILVEPEAARRELARGFEPDHLLDPSKDDIVVAVRHLTNGMGPDVVVCANPIAETQGQAVQMVRKAGTVVFFGGLPKERSLTTLDANRIHYGEITVAGSFSYHPAFHETALKLIARRLIPCADLITRTYPLEQIADAFNMAASGKALKVMVIPS